MSNKIAAVESGTGISRDRWLEFFDPHKNADHTKLASLALSFITSEGSSTSPEWWAQGATVAYEQHIGRREVGQQCDGSFAVNASATFPVDMDKALALIDQKGATLTEVCGVPVVGEPRISTTEKWRYWRIDLADNSRISITITAKAPGKSAVAVNHDKRSSNDDADAVKGFWKQFLMGAKP